MKSSGNDKRLKPSCTSEPPGKLSKMSCLFVVVLCVWGGGGGGVVPPSDTALVGLFCYLKIPILNKHPRDNSH